LDALSPRALAVLARQLRLRERFVAEDRRPPGDTATGDYGFLTTSALTITPAELGTLRALSHPSFVQPGQRPDG
jgi:hypothetical protein